VESNSGSPKSKSWAEMCEEDDDTCSVSSLSWPGSSTSNNETNSVEPDYTQDLKYSQVLQAVQKGFPSTQLQTALVKLLQDVFSKEDPKGVVDYLSQNLAVKKVTPDVVTPSTH